MVVPQKDRRRVADEFIDLDPVRSRSDSNSQARLAFQHQAFSNRTITLGTKRQFVQNLSQTQPIFFPHFVAY